MNCLARLLVALWATLAFPLFAQDTAPPNILLILADDLGYGDLQCYQPESQISTPHLDKLAAEGLRFTDAHSPSTVCTPTRYSILTGRMAFRTGMRGVFTGPGGPCLIEESRYTLPQMLRNEGYTTALMGKWHLGLTFRDSEGKPIHESSREAAKRIDYSYRISDGPIHRGFDHFFGTACCPTTDWIYAWIDGDQVPVPPVKEVDKSKLPDHPYSKDCRPGQIAPDFEMELVDEMFLAKSIAFLEKHAADRPDQPFFLFHSMQAVHLPSFPAPAFKGKTGLGPHGDFIHQMDDIVGRLLGTLDRLNLADNTLVLFTSDNGPEVPTVYHMRKDHDHDGAHPWRGMKRDQWEGGHRVPLIARWPGTIEAGRVTDQTVCLTDFMATAAAILSSDLPNDSAEDSVDLLPLLKGTQGDLPIREFTLHQTNTLKLAIRQGPWKFLNHKGSGGNNYERAELEPYVLPEKAPDAPGQLYHLEKDPGETTNLYNEHPEIVEELRKKLELSVQQGRSVPRRE